MNAETMKLEPCPFCGGEASAVHVRDGKGVACRQCHATVSVFHGPNRDTEQRLLAAWNRRSTPTGRVTREDVAALFVDHVRNVNRVIHAGMHEGPAIEEAADVILAMISAAPALEGEGWRPIETAPGQGVPFWAYQRGREQFVCWEQDTRDGPIWMDEADSEPSPTHWRPLPAAPPSPDAEPSAAGGA